MTPTQIMLLEYCHVTESTIHVPSVYVGWPKGLPPPDDEDHKVVSKFCIMLMNKMARAAELRTPALEVREYSYVSKDVAPPSTPIVHIEQPVPAPLINSVQYSEARIRSMSGFVAQAECDRLGLHFTRHPTNGGLNAMRAKNALLYNARKNAPVPVSQDGRSK